MPGRQTIIEHLIIVSEKLTSFSETMTGNRAKGCKTTIVSEKHCDFSETIAISISYKLRDRERG